MLAAGHVTDDAPCPTRKPPLEVEKHLLLGLAACDVGTSAPATQTVPDGACCVADAAPLTSHV